jgi:hypothetical protein
VFTVNNGNDNKTLTVDSSLYICICKHIQLCMNVFTVAAKSVQFFFFCMVDC